MTEELKPCPFCGPYGGTTKVHIAENPRCPSLPIVTAEEALAALEDINSGDTAGDASIETIVALHNLSTIRRLLEERAGALAGAMRPPR